MFGILANGMDLDEIEFESGNYTKPPEQECMSKQEIGERIYHTACKNYPIVAAKITGMILEMDNTELLDLLEDSQALKSKIREAANILEVSPYSDHPNNEQEQDRVQAFKEGDSVVATEEFEAWFKFGHVAKKSAWVKKDWTGKVLGNCKDCLPVGFDEDPNDSIRLVRREDLSKLSLKRVIQKKLLEELSPEDQAKRDAERDAERKAYGNDLKRKKARFAEKIPKGDREAIVLSDRGFMSEAAIAEWQKLKEACSQVLCEDECVQPRGEQINLLQSMTAVRYPADKLDEDKGLAVDGVRSGSRLNNHAASSYRKDASYGAIQRVSHNQGRQIVSQSIESGLLASDPTTWNTRRQERTPIDWAVIEGLHNALAHMVENGGDIRVADNVGWTPLHRAVLKDNLECAKILVEGNADLKAVANTWSNRKDKKLVPHTALELANGLGARARKVASYLETEKDKKETEKLDAQKRADADARALEAALGKDGLTPIQKVTNWRIVSSRTAIWSRAHGVRSRLLLAFIKLSN